MGITDSEEAVLYDVVDMTPTTFDIKEAESSTAATTQNAIGAIHEDSAGNIISQDPETSSSPAKHSLSEEGTIAPVKEYGNYNVYGKDVRLENDIAPTMKPSGYQRRAVYLLLISCKVNDFSSQNMHFMVK